MQLIFAGEIAHHIEVAEVKIFVRITFRMKAPGDVRYPGNEFFLLPEVKP